MYIYSKLIHIYTYVYIYIHTYIHVCVCVCVCGKQQLGSLDDDVSKYIVTKI